MIGNTCPRCGVSVVGDRVRFCPQCGYSLLSPGDRAGGTVQQSGHAKDDVDQEAAANPSETPSEGRRQDVLREAVASGAERLENVTESGGRGAKGQPEAHKVNTSRGLALSININQFYRQRFRGVLHIQLENLSDSAFDSIELEVSGDLLGRTERWKCGLSPCAGVEKRFGFKAEDAGVEMVAFIVDARQNESILSYWAEVDLPVFADTEDLRQIRLQADNMINVSAGTGKQMGNSVNNNISIMVDQGKIRNANDLMREYRSLLAEFELLTLTHDPIRSQEKTEELRRTRKEQRDKEDKDERIVDGTKGSQTDVASLLMEIKGRRTHIMLIAKPQAKLGKHRSNDLVTRICPRSPENDQQSNQISREHCRIELTAKGLMVRDKGSVNGTFLDGKRVDDRGDIIDGTSKELDLGGALKLGVRKLADRGKIDPTAYRKPAEGGPGQLWDIAEQAGIASLVLTRTGNLGPDDENGRESYCLVYRLATIGSDKDCALCIDEKGVEPVHAAVVYLRDRFYMKSLAEIANVIVNDRTLSRNELIPLSFGDRVRIGHLEMRFAPRSQLFVDG